MSPSGSGCCPWERHPYPAQRGPSPEVTPELRRTEETRRWHRPAGVSGLERLHQIAGATGPTMAIA